MPDRGKTAPVEVELGEVVVVVFVVVLDFVEEAIELGLDVVVDCADEVVEELSLPPAVNLGDFGFGILVTPPDEDEDEDEDTLTAPTVIGVIVLRLSLLRNRLRRLETAVKERRTGVAGVTEIEAATTARFCFGLVDRSERRSSSGAEGLVTAERLLFGFATTGTALRSTNEGEETERFALGFLTVAGRTTTGVRLSKACCCRARFALRWRRRSIDRSGPTWEAAGRNKGS